MTVVGHSLLLRTEVPTRPPEWSPRDRGTWIWGAVERLRGSSNPLTINHCFCVGTRLTTRATYEVSKVTTELS